MVEREREAREGRGKERKIGKGKVERGMWEGEGAS